MKITKFGHSCFLVDQDGVRCLFDPGTFSHGFTDLTNLDAILITHEHGDHMDVVALKEVLAKNPNAVMYTNASVQAILEKEGITAKVLTDGEVVEVKGVSIEGVGKDHAVMVTGVTPAQNVGFLIAERLFFPGDALTIPSKPVEILALPVAAPWSKISEVIDCGLAIKPTYIFPVHEAIYAHPDMMYGMFTQVFAKEGIEFRPMNPDGKTEF